MVEKNLRLKARIVLKFGTQADFADAVGVGEAWVSKVVTRRQYLPIEMEREWAAVLDCHRVEVF
jgi:hypothetical protein